MFKFVLWCSRQGNSNSWLAALCGGLHTTDFPYLRSHVGRVWWYTYTRFCVYHSRKIVSAWKSCCNCSLFPYMHRWESYLSSRRRPPSFYFLLFNAAWLLAGICFSSKNRWESATGSSLSPHRTYRDNGLILRSRNGAVVIRLCDWFVRDDGFREKRQSKCREWHTLLYSAMYRQKSMFFFCLFASNSDDARLPFQEDDNSRVESLSTFFVRLTLTSFRQSWLLCTTLFVSIR